MTDLVFPRAIYIRGTYPGQIDHPGWLSRVVQDEAAYLQAVAEGWSLEMRDPAPTPDPPAAAPVSCQAERPSLDEQRDDDVPVRIQVDPPILPRRRGRWPKGTD